MLAVALPTVVAQAVTPIAFGKSSLAGESSEFPTTLQFGPDGRLYVGQFDGEIKVYDVSRYGANSYAVTATQTITSIHDIPNHDDDGNLDPSVTGRLVTGILVTGTAQDPVIYVSSSDPRIGGGTTGTDTNLDTNSGMVSRLTWDGSDWLRQDLVRGLPRSEENHTGNGMALDPSTNTLYLAQGGNTNKGAPSLKFAHLPEYALSAAILSIDLDQIGDTTYDLPTLDDEDRPGDPDAHDPFGGDNGKNQATLVPGGPVQVYSPGYRNPYDVLLTQAGRMYTIDNGSNGTWGGVPIGEGPAGTCTNAINPAGGDNDPDNLRLIAGPGDYGGHPNPTRGNIANTFNGSSSSSPALVQRKAAPSAGATTSSVTLNAAPTEGDLLVARVGTTATGRTFSMSGWTPGPKNDRAQFFYKIVGAGESATITTNLSGSATTLRLLVDEWSHIDTVTPLDASVSTAKGSALTSLSTGVTATTSVADSIALTMHMLNGNAGGGVTFTNGFRTDQASGPVIAGSKVLTASGTQETTASWTTARAANAIIVVFRGASGGGGPPAQSPVTISNPVECDYRDPAIATPGNLATFVGSTDGLTEYTTDNFGGAMTGDLLAAAYSANAIYRLELSPDGTSVTSNTTLFSSVGSSSPSNPIDVIASTADDPFPGTVWVANTNGTIHVFEPDDFAGGGDPNCTRADDPNLDEDADGFDNADELDNATDPCSSADVPPDADGDLTSNLNDPDDDNDGIADTADPFAVDPANGSSTTLPVRYGWGSAESPGGLLNLGFTGLMTNGVSNYEHLFDAEQMTAGGAAGLLTVEKVPAGDAFKAGNAQQYGFQFGFVPPEAGTFTAHTRIVDPFGGMTPQNNQSMGMFIGTGDQDNYVKITTAAQNGTGIWVVKEVGGGATSRKTTLTMPGPDSVDLYLAVDVAAATVQPSFSVTTNGVSGPRQKVGAPIPIPPAWITMPVAAGILSTSRGPGPIFGATWDFIEVTGPPPGTWVTKASTPVARQEVAYTNVNGRLYLAGSSTRQEYYDPATDDWHTVAPLPAALNNVQSVAIGDDIYYLGGLVGLLQPQDDSVSIYHTTTNTFSEGTPMPAGRARGAGGAAVYDGKIYVAGGLHDGTSVPWFDVYDPVADTWTQLPDMPRARDHFHAAVVNGTFYAIGGRRSSSTNCCNATVTENDSFSLSTGSWSTSNAPLPTQRAASATAVLGDEILVIGGEGGGAVFDEVEAYDTTSNTWRELAPIPTPVEGMQAAVCNGGVYIAGGGTAQGGNKPTTAHQVFFLHGPTACTPTGDPPPG